MAKIGIDFGTGNTVLARYNETLQRAETLRIEGVSTEMRYRLRPDADEQSVAVIPSLIHYGEQETLLGDQVLSRGLSEHPHTFRWMKRYIAQGGARVRNTPQGHKSPVQAGEDFLRRLLAYVQDQVSFTEDEFTFTAPTEAFEKYADWLRKLYESLGIRRLRLLDEPTACVFGYHGASRKDDPFLVFDFGCGTLDISVVQVDLASSEDKKALQLGQAGHDIGGMDLDRWLKEDFCQRHGMDANDQRELEPILLLRAEETKIALSDPARDEADMLLLLDRAGKTRTLRTTYLRSCPECERGRPGKHTQPQQSCLGCILLEKGFLRRVRETLDRALENAAVKAGLRRDRLVKVLVTGGTSLVPCVRKLLVEAFDSRAEYQSPFDAVARGACGGFVLPILQHDYSIEGYSRERKRYEFQPLFTRGTDYPTRDAVQMWMRGSYDGMTRLALRIYEVSQLKHATLAGAIMDDHGRLEENRVASDFHYICLNSQNPTFIVADPPVNLARDAKRFLCRFEVDGQRRLLVTVLDNLKPPPDNELYKDHPVVRL
jgi:molecular chaperone DnaK